MKVMRSLLAAVALIAGLTLFMADSAKAEEVRDLREGITGEQPIDKQIGLLPRFRYNPDTGFGIGAKFKAQNLFGRKMLVEADNIYTTKNYQTYAFTVLEPRLFEKENSWFYFMGSLYWLIDPDYRFFGIGNETKRRRSGSNPGQEANFDFRSLRYCVDFGWHPGANFYIALEPFYRQVWLAKSSNHKMLDGMFWYGGFPGHNGGNTSGLGLHVIHSTRTDQWRPTKGHRLELIVEGSEKGIFSNYDFARYTLDFRYYRLLFGKYNILAFHMRLQTLEGSNSQIPWWELSTIGGRDTLRGYWQDRFSGKSSVLANIEYRFHILSFKPKVKILNYKPDFNFDGIVFLDTGQVFDNEKEMEKTTMLKLHNTMGVGIRMLTPPNLMGRLDIGISPEAQYAMYFNFGTVF